MQKLQFSILVASAISASNCLGIEPLKDSSSVYNEAKARQTLAEHDANNDGLIQENEAPKRGSLHKLYDANNDGNLDLDELKNVQLKYIDSPGKKLLNVLYKRTEDGDVFFDFYFPDVDDSSAKPVVIYTHGGGWATGSKHGAGHASFNVVHKQLLQQGFCVLSVGYRLWSKDGNTAMRDCVIDSKDALRYISAYYKELGIDPNKIYTFGDSAGGHLSQMILLSPPESLSGDSELAQYSYKTVAGVSWYGPCDFENEQLFNHDDRANFRDRFGPRIMGTPTGPQGKVERYREMSPVNYLTESSPALLMIQGDKDTTIPVKQALRMQEALQTIDAPVEFIIVKNAGHNWRSVDAPIEPGRNEIIDATVQFILKHK